MVTGKLTTLQLSVSSTPSQQVDSLAQVLLLDEFKVFTCKHIKWGTDNLSANVFKE